jgi:peptidyl-prolyl cis-trans isomerase B (cyclophilin B)
MFASHKEAVSSMSSRSRALLTAALALVFLSLLSLAGCGGVQETPNAVDDSATNGGTAEQPAPADPTEDIGGEDLYTPEYQPNGKEVAVFKTSKGVIRVGLYGKDAPIHVGNFVELASEGFYDNTKFHRYEPSFVVQGGDPQTKEYSSEQVNEVVRGLAAGPAFGTGGPGYSIKGEFDPAVNPNKHVEGALGMARSQSPDSAGSQFYFALQPLPQLDGGYTVFGVVVEGLDVVKELRVGDEIESVTISGASD